VDQLDILGHDGTHAGGLKEAVSLLSESGDKPLYTGTLVSGTDRYKINLNNVFVSLLF